MKSIISFSSILLVSLAATSVVGHQFSEAEILAREVEGAIEARGRSSSSSSSRRANRFGNSNNNGGSSLTLQSNLVQKASQKTGLEADAEAGTVASKTSSNNFINFCSGKTLTNGQQVKTGSCNGIPQGQIPAVDKVPTARFKTPANGQNFAANKNFTVELQIKHLNSGAFTNPTITYFAAPAEVDSSGIYIGHSHIVVQKVQSATSTELLDTQTFAFFKGLNTKAENGILSTVVGGGLPAGNYRICSITSASNHAVVNGPVAQRGAIDDCTYFTTGGGSSNSGSSNNNNNGGSNNGGNGNNGKRCDAKRLARKRALAEKKRELRSLKRRAMIEADVYEQL